ncbi:Rrf2 family transcriptional regulator [bacterium]|nr:Rrf2 family transcriptional regulator [bacterium]
MLSMKAKYALRALMVLTSRGGKMAAKELAQEADVPSKFLEAILLELKQHGLVESKRGIFGGYILSRDPFEIPVGEVVRALDGSLAPIRCASQNQFQPCDDCPDVQHCAIRKLMVEVRNAIAGVLDRTNLAELTRSNQLPVM